MDPFTNTELKTGYYMKALGLYLNQIARHLNEYGTPYADLEKEVRDADVDLAEVRSSGEGGGDYWQRSNT